MTEPKQPTPEQQAAIERAWQRFESRNPDLMGDRQAVEKAAGVWAKAQEAAGATLEETLDGLADGTEETLRKKLGSQRFTDALAEHQRKLWEPR